MAASGRTTRAHLPFPTGADPFTLRGDFELLAEALDNYAPILSGTLTARPASNAVLPDTLYWATNTGTLARADGVTAGQGGWSDVSPKDAAANVASLRTLGTGAQQAAAGNDSRLSNQRTPTDGSVTNAKVAAGAAVDEGKLALASDAAPGTPSRRSLGTGAQQALPGNHASVTNARVPLSHGATHAAGGSDPVPGVGGNAPAHKLSHEPGGADALTALTDASFAAANKDGPAGTPSLRTLGTGALQATAGDDARLSDQRTPPDNSVTATKVHTSLKPSSGAATNVEALRAIGTGASNAAAGNDPRLSDQRTPADGSVTNAKVAAGAGIAESKLSLASDAAAGTPSRRTLGTGATQAAPGNDGRFSHFGGVDVFANDLVVAFNGGASQIALGRTAPATEGPGITFGNAQDTNLYRGAANQLKTDDAFVVGGALTVGGTLSADAISTATLTGTTTMTGALHHTGASLGVFGAATRSKGTISSARAGSGGASTASPALRDLLQLLDGYGLLNDNSTQT